jgi:hypothetical protein
MTINIMEKGYAKKNYLHSFLKVGIFCLLMNQTTIQGIMIQSDEDIFIDKNVDGAIMLDGHFNGRDVKG